MQILNVNCNAQFIEYDTGNQQAWETNRSEEGEIWFVSKVCSCLPTDPSQPRVLYLQAWLHSEGYHVGYKNVS